MTTRTAPFLTAAAAGLLSLGTHPALAQVASEEPPRDATGKMTDKDQFDTVECRTEPVIGSRAKKRKICMKQSQWAEVGRKGNTFARQLVEDHASIFSPH